MDPIRETMQWLTRRQFFGTGVHAMGWAALASLLERESVAANSDDKTRPGKGAALAQTHHPARARNIIYLHMLGGAPQMDMYDYKPKMADLFDKDLPDSVRRGQRLTTMSTSQSRLPIAPSTFSFARYGQCGMWVSELLPWTARMVDDLCFVRSMHTDAINHEPAVTFMQTGNQVAGRPSLGAWCSYGLGSLNQNLPTFVVLVAQPTSKSHRQAVSTRLWQSGYLPGEHAGVVFRTSGDPVLYLSNPPGVSPEVRRKTLDGIKALNEIRLREVGNPETATRIQQYEMAFRMQASVPGLADLGKEPESTFQLYGDEARKPGTFANTALLACRLVEQGVRFVQIYHNSWDMHSKVVAQLPVQCRDIDQGCYGLIQDLKRRGLLESTLVIWGGEFGRTIYSQGGLNDPNYGRDHHSRCFTMWFAGGGVKAGTIYGETDEFSYNVVQDPVHVRDFHATVLHLLGVDHKRLTVRFQGLDQRLTGVEAARVVQELLA